MHHTINDDARVRLRRFEKQLTHSRQRGGLSVESFAAVRDNLSIPSANAPPVLLAVFVYGVDFGNEFGTDTTWHVTLQPRLRQ
jgi:hypothetical protein